MLFSAVACEWHTLNESNWCTKVALDIDRQIREDVNPFIGGENIAQIRPKQILPILRAKAHATHKVKRLLQYINRIFAYAVACEYCETNPARELGPVLPPHKTKGNAFLQFSELPDFFKAIRSNSDMSATTAAAFLMIFYTAKRRSEVVYAEWSEFNLDEALWRIPTGRMKTKREHLCPLSTQAVELLRAQQLVSGGSKYVFASDFRKGIDRPISPWMLWCGIKTAGYKGRMTVHGTRNVFSTHAHESGLWGIDSVELQLAHFVPGVRGIYNHGIYLAERARLVQWWADEVDKLRGMTQNE